METKLKVGDKVKRPTRKTFDQDFYPLATCALIKQLNQLKQDHAFISSIASNRRITVTTNPEGRGELSCFNEQDLDLYDEVNNNYLIY